MAILNGITMGGGAGISIPGTFRLATDRTVCCSDLFWLFFLSVIHLMVLSLLQPIYLLPCNHLV